MRTPDWTTLLAATAERAAAHLEGLAQRRVGATASPQQLRDALGGELADEPIPPEQVVAELAAAVEPGLVASPGGRYFGFVIGGALPAAAAADWLVTAWDQNAGGWAVAPATMAVEEVASAWLIDLLGLPAGTSTGFVTGGQAANTTALAAGRHAVLRAAGWDVETQGLHGAPPVAVVVGGDRHATVDRAVRLLGLGSASLRVVDADDQGRLQPRALARTLGRVAAPALVVTQLGEIHTGALDPVGDLVEVAHDHGSWVHVDGAFGLWARASPRLRELTAGVERADSWATDAHKWLNVPYDCGLAMCSDSAAHRAAMSISADYLVRGQGVRDAHDWNPELSRRARAIPVYAALRSLGRRGVAELIEGCCAHARRFAALLAADPGAEVLNDVVLNQAIVRFDDDDGRTLDVARRVQQEGTCWLGTSMWRGQAVIRLSVSNWSTDSDDIDRSAAAVLRCLDASRRQDEGGQAQRG